MAAAAPSGRLVPPDTRNYLARRQNTRELPERPTGDGLLQAAETARSNTPFCGFALGYGKPVLPDAGLCFAPEVLSAMIKVDMKKEVVGDTKDLRLLS